MNQDAKKILRISLVSIFFVLILVFVFLNSRDLLFGVKIKNVNLRDNLKVTDSIFEITGSAKNAVKLSLNGREISVDQKGDFDETISFLPGYNVVNIKAQDKFGNVDEKNYKVMSTGN
jgi:hypothetical protein